MTVLSKIEVEIEDRLLSNKAKLPSAPDIVLKLNALINDENSTISDIAKVVRTHQTLAAKLLQVANSPLLRHARPVVDLSEAVSSIGLTLVRNVAVGLSLSNMFKTDKPELRKKLAEAWEHSLTVGALSSILVKELDDRRYDPSIALLCGILHSIGVLVVIDYFNETDAPLDALDEAVDKLSDTLSAHLLTSWHLPQSFISAIEGGASVYGDVLKYVHCFLRGEESTLFGWTNEAFEKTVKDNKDLYESLISIFR